MQISKEALQNDDSNDEGLTEEDLKVSLHHLCVQGLKHTMDLFRRRDDESRDGRRRQLRHLQLRRQHQTPLKS